MKAITRTGPALVFTGPNAVRAASIAAEVQNGSPATVILMTEPLRSKAIHDSLEDRDAFSFVPAQDADGRLVVSPSNGKARTYVQLSRSLGLQATLTLIRGSTDVECNFTELQALASRLQIPVPSMSEDDPKAFRWAARVLSQLNNECLAGAFSTVVTLGRNGAVVANWMTGRTYALRFMPLDKRAIVETPAGVGDWMIGLYVLWNHTWASPHFLRYPVMASVERSMHWICRRKLGLPPDSYGIDTSLL